MCVSAWVSIHWYFTPVAGFIDMQKSLILNVDQDGEEGGWAAHVWDQIASSVSRRKATCCWELIHPQHTCACVRGFTFVSVWKQQYVYIFLGVCLLTFTHTRACVFVCVRTCGRARVCMHVWVLMWKFSPLCIFLLFGQCHFHKNCNGCHKHWMKPSSTVLVRHT